MSTTKKTAAKYTYGIKQRHTQI